MPTPEELDDLEALGDRPATEWVARVVCYCHPERCADAR